MLEGELAVAAAGDAGGEELLLGRWREGCEGCERFGVILDFEPVQRERGVVVERGFARVVGGEVLVAGANARPVGGLGDGDVEGARVIAVGEDAAGELKEQQVERRLEVGGEVRLDDGGADGAKVVAERVA